MTEQTTDETTPQPSEVEVAIRATLYRDDTAVRTIMLGGPANPTILIQIGMEDGQVVHNVEAGGGPETFGQVADVLEFLASAMRSREAQQADAEDEAEQADTEN